MQNKSDGKDLRSMVNFNNHWGDETSNKRLYKSPVHNQELQKAEIINHLSDMAMRFERYPNKTTTDLWAKDLAESGVPSSVIKDVCKSVPFKFQRHPSFSEIMELIRPYLAQVSEIEDELDNLTHRCQPHLRKKFISVLGEDKLTLMVAYYEKHAFPEMKSFNIESKEKLILGDWLRSYFGNAEAIVRQGHKSNEAVMYATGPNKVDCIIKDKEYFIKPYRIYAKENGL